MTNAENRVGIRFQTPRDLALLPRTLARHDSNGNLSLAGKIEGSLKSPGLHLGSALPRVEHTTTDSSVGRYDPPVAQCGE